MAPTGGRAIATTPSACSKTGDAEEWSKDQLHCEFCMPPPGAVFIPPASRDSTAITPGGRKSAPQGRQNSQCSPGSNCGWRCLWTLQVQVPESGAVADSGTAAGAGAATGTGAAADPASAPAGA